MDALSNEEIENCRIAFNKFDKDMSGSISDWELRAMLQCTLREAHHMRTHLYICPYCCLLLPAPYFPQSVAGPCVPYMRTKPG
jgi:hypothetical protein